MDQELKDRILNWGTLLLLGGVWGCSFFFIKRGLVAFDPLQVGMIRIFFAFLSFIPLFFIVGWKVPRKKVPVVVVSAMLGSGLPPFLFAFAQSRITSGVTGILNSLTPLFALVTGVLFFRVVIKSHHIVGVLIGLIGSLLVVIFRYDGAFEFEFLYALLVVLATAFYGTNANIIKSTLHDVHPIQIALATFFILGPIAGIGLFTLTDFTTVVRQHPQAVGSLFWLAILSVFGTSYALILFNYLAHRTSALFATMVTYIIPVVAVIIGLIDGEQIGIIQFAGLLMILAGVYVSSFRKRKEKL